MERLPTELLAYIFTLATHGRPTEDHDDLRQSKLPFNPDDIPIPFTLSTINRYWRQVALTTPSLWTSICVTWRETHDDATKESSSERKSPTELAVVHVIISLARSRNYPLNILIDARDPAWDFSETESELQPEEGTTYHHPFTSGQMHDTFDLILPHIHRWRSLTILTDTWAPMYASLQRLSSPTPSKAPLLEVLTLMRCNEFVGYLTEFMPGSTRNQCCLFLDHMLQGEKLPRLRNLILSGVHVDWAGMTMILPDEGLHTLELSYHSLDVRPSPAEFIQLLQANQGLRKLVVNVSGPVLDNAEDQLMGTDQDGRSDRPITLLALEEVALGYADVYDGWKILDLLYAPNTRILHLEDNSNPEDVDDLDAACLLTYCGTGLWDGDGQSQLEEADDIVHKDEDDDSEATKGNVRSPFLQLEEMTLRKVKSKIGPFRTLFASLPNLQRLSLDHTSMHALEALLPDNHNGQIQCLCPELKTLCVQGVTSELDLISDLASKRAEVGAGLQVVDIYADDGYESLGENELTIGGLEGTKIRVDYGENPEGMDWQSE